MSEQHDSQPTEGAGTGHPPRQSASWWPVAIPAIALLVGLLIGGVVVGVADNDEAPSSTEQPTSSPSTGTSAASAAESPTNVVVPAECLAAVDTVDELTDLTKQGAGAIRNLETQQLRELLTKLQRLDERARQQAQACRAVKVESSPDQ